MLFNLYRFLTRLSGPALRCMTAKRLKAGKEIATRMNERYGLTDMPRPQGKIMWCHGASVGESLSVLPLLQTLHARLPDWHIILTTNTVTSAAILEKRLPPYVKHQFIPWDHPVWVKRFMDHWKPDIALWLESELWPNLLHELKTRRIPTALLNARMRPKTMLKWKKAHELIRYMLSTFKFTLVGARTYRPVFESFGAQNVRYIGSLKFGAQALPASEQVLAELRAQIGGRKLIGFLSTHPTEEDLMGDAFKELKKEYPDLLAIVVPRKADRANDIAAELNAKGLKTATRSQGGKIAPDTDFYIADTMGEMGLWYSLCPTVIIGGSFIPHGGQNPIEGTHFGAAIFYGPHMFNFPELTKALEESGAAHPIASREQLLPTLQQALRDPAKLQAMQMAARDLATQNITVIDAFADEIILQLVQGQ
jgi:3-deoxy-D-manno-octulosonic-acid transferase